MKRQAVLPPTYLWAAMILMVALHFLIPAVRLIPFPWQLIGLLPLVLGAALNVIANKAFRDAKTTVKPFQESAALVTTGAFGLSRHPMYLGLRADLTRPGRSAGFLDAVCGRSTLCAVDGSDVHRGRGRDAGAEVRPGLAGL